MAAEDLSASKGREESIAAIEKLRAEITPLRDDVSRWIEALPRLQESLQSIFDQTLSATPTAADAQSWWLQEAHARFLDVREQLETLVPWLRPEFASLRTYFDDMVVPKLIGSLNLEQLPGYAQRLSTRLEQSLVLNPGDHTKHEKIRALQHGFQQCSIRAM